MCNKEQTDSQNIEPDLAIMKITLEFMSDARRDKERRTRIERDIEYTLHINEFGLSLGAGVFDIVAAILGDLPTVDTLALIEGLKDTIVLLETTMEERKTESKDN